MRAMRHVVLVLAMTMAVATASGARASAAAEHVASSAAPRQIDWATGGWSPAADWRTLEVPGYRLYFPAPAEPWARHLAARLPALRERVAKSVGWDADEVVEIVLVDPIAQPNGAAWPLLGRPRLVLLLTPPGASSQLGEYADWPELLVIHEQAHLSHLLRPSRNPLLRMLRLPLGPISLRAPRWTVEGYATVVEGQLTGSGRPSNPFRAAVLRRWAQRGRLPSYGALAGDSRRYLGQSMAYLGGSAFLEWLERRSGEESLDRLWRRLTARRLRNFDDAFRGVFGEKPAALWDRFSAELTWQALEAERRLAGSLREGEPWLDRSWGTGRPALSRDGARLVLTLYERDQPPRLAVYATADDAEAAQRREEERRRLLERDPEDMPAVASGAPEREPLATLELDGTTVDPSPRFLADGSVLFARTLPDGDGTFHADLYRWRPESGEVERLTHDADLRDADPSPDGAWAVAVESRWGQTRLVRVDLATAEVMELTPASVEVVVDAPRVSPDGERVAFLRHRGEGWELVVRELASGAERIVPTPAGAAVQDPAWTPDGEALLAVVSEDGLLDVQRLPIDGASGERITRTLGAALAPEPSPDGGAVYFLALEPEGLQVRRIALDGRVQSAAGNSASTPTEASAPARAPPQTATTPAPEGAAAALTDGEAAQRQTLSPSSLPLDAAELYPALPPSTSSPLPPLARIEVPPSRDYGAGRAQWSLLSGGSAGPGASSAEVGVRGGDIVGRWDLLAVGALAAAGGTEGGAVAGAWRRWPVELSAHGYHVRERPSAHREAAREAGTAFDVATSGVELAAAWQRALLGGHYGARLAIGEERLDPDDPDGGDELTRRGALVDVFAAKEVRHGLWRAGGELALAWQSGSTGGDAWDRRGGRLALDLAHNRSALALTLSKQELTGDPTPVDLLRVGGLPTTLLPPFATGNRIEAPALPAAALVGSGYEGQRVTLTMPGLPMRPFWERHRVERSAEWSDWLALAGLAFELRLPPLPLLELPAARLHLGAAYGLDEPYRGDVHGWIAIAWRP